MHHCESDSITNVVRAQTHGSTVRNRAALDFDRSFTDDGEI